MKDLIIFFLISEADLRSPCFTTKVLLQKFKAQNFPGILAAAIVSFYTWKSVCNNISRDNLAAGEDHVHSKTGGQPP